MEVKIRNRAPMEDRYTYGTGISLHTSDQAPKKLKSISQAIGRSLAAEHFDKIRQTYFQTTY